MATIKIKEKENTVKTHKNKAGVKCRWAIGLLFNSGIRFVTSIKWQPKTFKWESGKEAMYFDSKEHVDDIAFGIQMNFYPAVVMEVPDGFILKNPEEENAEEE